MSNSTTVSPEVRVKEASEHLYQAFTHRFGPLDMGAHQPIVLAISEFGQKSRDGDDEGMHAASQHVYEALTHHFGPLDIGAHDKLTLALAEYGEACRAAGPRAK
jgi:hypothetical protein